jgi:Peptidase M50B-like
MNEARHATAIHEAGHAVVCYLLGGRVIKVLLRDDRQGWTETDSTFCEDDLNYYRQHNSEDDLRSSKIQDGLLRDIAIAVAGKIAQGNLCGDSTLIESELEQDLKRARCGAANVHRRLDGHGGLASSGCYFPKGQCSFCEGLLVKIRSAVKAMLARSLVTDAILNLATNKLVSLNDGESLIGSELHP